MSARSRWSRDAARRPDGAWPRAQDAGRPGRLIARLPGGDRREAGLRRSLLEHGEPQGVPLRGCRGRGHGGAAQAGRPQRQRRDPFPLRARQGVGGQGRLRPGLALLRHRQPEAAQAGISRPGDGRSAPRPDHRGVRAASSSSGTPAQGDESAGADLHRRTAALGLDADRADPREPQPGRRHAGAADARRLASSIGRYRRDRKQYPDAVRDLRGKDFRAYGRQYLDERGAYRFTDKPHFTDKLPNNFSHVGLST